MARPRALAVGPSTYLSNSLGDADSRRASRTDRANGKCRDGQVGIGKRDAASGAATQAEQAAYRFAHPERGDTMSNGLLGVTESRRDLLQRERSREPYFAQN